MIIDLPIKGHFKLSLYDAITNELVGVREAENLVVSGGLNILTQALNWVIVQNQNASWGSPFTAFTNVGDAWAAVGTSSTAPSGGQTALGAEIGRAIITAGAYAANQLVYDFFLGTTLGNGAITEIGMFLQANLITPSLTSALVATTNYSSLSVTSTVADIPSGSVLTIGYGTAQTQQVTTISDTPPSSTTISVASFTANANYAGGTLVAYTPGVMLDRTTFGAITKTSSMTGVLEITLTLVSG